MASEFDIVTAGRTHQEDLLAEAGSRRQLSVRTVGIREPRQPTGRLQTLLRRLAGAPAFA
jgi:hypothetical protein